MENSAPSNVWTHCARWHRYFASLIETNVFEISCFFLYIVLFCNLYLTIWCKDNKLIIYISYITENLLLHWPLPLKFIQNPLRILLFASVVVRDVCNLSSKKLTQKEGWVYWRLITTILKTNAVKFFLYLWYTSPIITDQIIFVTGNYLYKNECIYFRKCRVDSIFINNNTQWVFFTAFPGFPRLFKAFPD